MRRIIYPICLSFITFYMLFIYEPIVMLSNNIDDLWFDLHMMLPSIIIITFILTTILLLLYFILYIIFNEKHKKVFDIVTIVHFVLFFILYIHGNFMAKKLHILDGTKFALKNYTIDIIVSVVVILLIIIIAIISIKKFGTERIVKISKYLSIIIFIMLSVGLISTLISNPKVLKEKTYMPIATYKNIQNYSKNKNFIMFVLDGADSREFDKARKNSKYKNIFKDFTYYPDTMSTYGNTSNSVPYILTGIWDEKTEEFNEYSKNAYKNSHFFKLLRKNKYNMNIYANEIIMNSNEGSNILNFYYQNSEIDTYLFFKEEVKYISFKYLPYFLKSFSGINSLKLTADIISVKDEEMSSYNYYSWDNLINYDTFRNGIIKKKNKNEFKYIHIEGPHLPFNMDEDLNIIDEGTYTQKIKASLKIVDVYLNKLKDEKIYDNSVIIIMSDHGLSENPDFKGRQNPILFIKGINEHHDFKVSDKPISYTDLMGAYEQLLNGKKSIDLFKNIKKDRKRRFLYYPDQYSNMLIELYQTGKAWDLNTMKETGKTYVLEKKDEK